MSGHQRCAEAAHDPKAAGTDHRGGDHGYLRDAAAAFLLLFYGYFTDIYDLLRWTFEKEALELLQQQQGVSPWQNGFLHLFQYINQNRAVCLCALDSLGKESLKQLLEADVSSIVDRAVRQTAVENGLPAHSPEVEVVICLVTIMMAGAVESWLRGELTQTPEELTRRIDMMFQDYIRGVALRLKASAAVYA